MYYWSIFVFVRFHFVGVVVILKTFAIVTKLIECIDIELAGVSGVASYIDKNAVIVFSFLFAVTPCKLFEYKELHDICELVGLCVHLFHCRSLAVGSRNGFSLFSLNSVDSSLEEIYTSSGEEINIVERLFSSSLVAVVSLNAPRKLKVINIYFY